MNELNFFRKNELSCPDFKQQREDAVLSVAVKAAFDRSVLLQHLG